MTASSGLFRFLAWVALVAGSIIGLLSLGLLVLAVLSRSAAGVLAFGALCALCVWWALHCVQWLKR